MSTEMGLPPEAAGSPYPREPFERTISVHQHLKLSAYWFATNFLWGALIPIMLPGEIKNIAPHMRILALGILTPLSALVAVVVPLVAGAMSDRCAHPLGRRRPYIITGVGITLIGLLLMALVYRARTPIGANLGHEPHLWQALGILFTSPTYLLFMLALMVVQFGNNIASAAYSGIIPDLVPPDQRGVASGYMALMSQAGTLFGALGCGLLLTHHSESFKYLIISTVLGGIALITVMGVQEIPLKEKPTPMDWGQYLGSLWIDPRKFPDFAWVWVTRAFVMLGFYSVVPFLNYYLTDVIGFENPDVVASILTGVILLFASISGIVGGILSDKVGRKRMVYLSNTAMALVGLGFIFCVAWWQVLVVGILFGLAYGAYISVDWALGTDVLPSKTDAGKEMAVWHIAMTMPQTIAGPVAAALIEVFGKTVSFKGDDQIVHYTLKGYSAVFILASACFGLGAYFLRNVRGVK